MNILNNTGRGIVWITTLSVAIISWRFLIGGVSETMEIVVHNLESRSIPLYGHLIFGPIALALLPFQFWGKLRQKRPDIHRLIGRISVLAIFIAGISSLIIAPFTSEGPIAATGFFLLGLAWLFTTAVAVNHIRSKRIAEHRKWMIRSASLTFAGVMLRVYLPLFFITTNLEFSQFYPIVAWLCWVPNIILAEIYLRRSN